jgi:hypothetical protein
MRADEFLTCGVPLALLLIFGFPVLTFIFIRRLQQRHEESTRQMTELFGLLRREQRRTSDLVIQLGNRLAGETPEAEHRPETQPPLEVVAEAEASVPAEPAPAIPTESISETAAPPTPPLIPEPTLSHTARASQPQSTRAPAAASQPPREPPSRFARANKEFDRAAKEILRKIWNWIIVGEDHIPEGVSMEYAVATQWLLRIGVVILVMGIGFFLKYSIERGLIGPVARVCLSTAAGLGLLISGTQMLGRRYHLFGQGLIGAGLATLYFSVFAAASLHHLGELAGLTPQAETLTAFGLMALITITAGCIAVRFNTVLAAVLGLLGGYGTPVMLSTGVVNFPGLYSYMLLLGVGILVVCIWKDWPLVNFLSFLCTYGLVFTSLARDYRVEYFWEVMPFLTAFFVLFSTMVFVHNIATRVPSTLLDLIGLFVNAGIFFGVSYALIQDNPALGQRWVAAVTLGLAIFYIAHVYLFLVRRLLDRGLLLSFTGLAAFFLSVTVPLVLSSEWITASWALQALVLLWIAGKLRSEFLRHVAYVLYMVVFVRFGLVDLPDQFLMGAVPADMPLRDYAWQLVQRLVMFGVPIASIAGAYFLVRQPGAPAAVAVSPANDMPGGIDERWVLRAAVAVFLGMLFIYLHFEMDRTVGLLFAPLRLPLLTLLWLAMCVYLLYEYVVGRSQVVLVLLAVFVVAVMFKLFFFDLVAWQIGYPFLYGPDFSFGESALRLLDFGAVIGFFAVAYSLLSCRVEARTQAASFGTLALVLLFVYTTLELNTFLHYRLPGLEAGGVSILWSLFALGMIVSGIWKNIRALRLAGLGLFAVVTAKVFLMDLAWSEPFYRIIAFIILGLLLLSGSFVYLKYRHAFTVAPQAEGQSN